ncbi:MAG: hypothetical protein NTX71_12070 [Candidatus Aureabacteria bacterium]|nr:hypothetical protein [Candidatus Auribacterota bacterium]
MGRVIIMAFACCMLTRPAVCGETSKDLEFPSMDWNTWRQLDNRSKVYWLIGYREGTMAGVIHTTVRSSAPDPQKEINSVDIARDVYPTELDPNQSTREANTIAALNKFYSDYKNINIPVSFALVTITCEIHGTKKETIEKILEGFRKANAPTVGEAKDKK